jgi:hypothetical protein
MAIGQEWLTRHGAWEYPLDSSCMERIRGVRKERWVELLIDRD